jgi:anti-sigma B factor antagonist
MKLACLQKKPRMVFEITRAYKVFEIFDTVEEAIKAAK